MNAFHKYRKITPTVARKLTQADYEQRGGVIQTNEGPAPFEVGNYLARDIKGEWPIHQMSIEGNYERIDGPDQDGWCTFLPLDIREACQMGEVFIANGLTGQPGDYLVRSGENQWPVEQDIFETSYEMVED